MFTSSISFEVLSEFSMLYTSFILFSFLVFLQNRLQIHYY
ncbi:putative membrane protein [[Clostridium] sordellii VPI 9048]|nr:putative membrane protein [[Clostridium] sordellii VPI 9048] [Paeniclostridium sordellii VPI 9048]